MNKLILALSLMCSAALAQSAMAAEVLKMCAVNMTVPGEKIVPTIFEIVKDGTKLSSKVTQWNAGVKQVLPPDAVQMTDLTVRKDLSSESKDMNLAELMVQGTAGFLKDPDMAKAFSISVDLKAIRSARVYQIGKFSNMGGTVIVETKDETGKYLGSFVTGFIPFGCIE